jgi:hypothetical protein
MNDYSTFVQCLDKTGKRIGHLVREYEYKYNPEPYNLVCESKRPGMKISQCCNPLDPSANLIVKNAKPVKITRNTKGKILKVGECKNASDCTVPSIYQYCLLSHKNCEK